MFQYRRTQLLGVSELRPWVPRRGAPPRAPGRPRQLGARAPGKQTQPGEDQVPLGFDSHHHRHPTNLGRRRHKSYPRRELSRHPESACCLHYPDLPSQLRPGPHPSGRWDPVRPPSVAAQISIRWKQRRIEAKCKKGTDIRVYVGGKGYVCASCLPGAEGCSGCGVLCPTPTPPSSSSGLWL